MSDLLPELWFLGIKKAVIPGSVELSTLGLLKINATERHLSASY